MKPLQQIIEEFEEKFPSTETHHFGWGIDNKKTEELKSFLTQALKDYGDYLIAQIGEEMKRQVVGHEYGTADGVMITKYAQTEDEVEYYNTALADARSNMKKANQ